MIVVIKKDKKKSRDLYSIKDRDIIYSMDYVKNTLRVTSCMFNLNKQLEKVTWTHPAGQEINDI